MRTATLKVSAAQLENLPSLPEGFGLALHEDGLHIDVAADGEGGVNVTARADSSGRRVDSWLRTAILDSHQESCETEEEEKSPERPWWLSPWAFLGAALVSLLIKRLFDNS